MKIKLRDITDEQYDKWKQGCKNRACENCPIRIVNRMVNCAESSVSYSWIDYKGNFSNKFLDQEIEIEDENEKENIPLTDDENATLRLVYKEYKYIARDADERLHLFKEEPFKVKGQWMNYEQFAAFYPFNDYFKCVRGTDYEPTLIADLLK